MADRGLDQDNAVLAHLVSEWDKAIERYASIPSPHTLADYNVETLEALRPRWGAQLRVTTSMFRLMFTRPLEHWAFDADEWVVFERRVDGRVEMMLMRRIPRRSLEVPGGTGVVAGDIAWPESAFPPLEAMLWQLAEPVGE